MFILHFFGLLSFFHSSYRKEATKPIIVYPTVVQRFRIFTMLLGLSLLVACDKATPVTISPPPSSASGDLVALVSSTVALNDHPTYTLFAPEFVGKGKNAVLFFARADDPFSVRNDFLLRAIYASGAALISTYRLEFSTSTGARLTYGAIVPDTFILLGPNGERQNSIIHPTEVELRSFLGA